MNITDFFKNTFSQKEKKPMPILSFPSVSLIGSAVTEITKSAELQAAGMKAVADRTDALAAVSMMDLSVEAEAFGCEIRIIDGEVPTVISGCVASEKEANELSIPAVGAARTGIYVDAIAKAKKLITDRPVFAGIIGPFSLAGRLIGVDNVMFDCFDEPKKVEVVLKKATEFLISYANAFKAAGADGIVMAEPLTGILSPSLADEFSHPYVKEIIDAVRSDSFAVIYHNCGASAQHMTESLSLLGATAYHFGDALDMEYMVKNMPADTVIMGNVSPAAQFAGGTPDSMAQAVTELLEKYSRYPNFLLSSGCDIPPSSPWENIDAFFKASKDFYND